MNSLLIASVDLALQVVVPLMDEAPEAEDVNAGWWNVLVDAALITATLLLWLSMRKQLKKIRFDDQAPTDAGTERDGEDPGAVK